MDKLPSEGIKSLIDNVLAKHKWTKAVLAKHLGIAPNAISRWLAGKGIHKVHHEELLRLSRGESGHPAEPINFPIRLPFHVTIPKSTLRVAVDERGNIDISGILLATLNKEDK